MTDSTPVPPARKSRVKAKPAEAVSPPVESDPVIPEPETLAPVIPEPRIAENGSPESEVTTHTVPLLSNPAPVPPKNRSNRGVGSLLAVLSGVLFAALLAVGTAVIGAVRVGSWSLSFLTDGLFYIPVAVFVVGFVILVLIFNRANWWAYIIGSVILGVFVYFGTAAIGLLVGGVVTLTPARAAAVYSLALRDPFVILSALLAREVVVWCGALVASRGRRLKIRNAEARAQYRDGLATPEV